ADDFNAGFLAYFPDSVTVHPGDTIVYESNFSGEPHSITFGTMVDDVVQGFRALTPEQQESFGDTEAVSGKRADTVILLHLDEERKQVVLVQFPRDLRVQDPQGEIVKMNSVYEQGPEAMIETVSAFSGMPINHYVEVDFAGFNSIADALGGVEVYFEEDIFDPDSGLDVEQGCQLIEGDQALAFVRARKIDDDFGRIRRQQLFLKLMVDKTVTPGTLLRPSRVVSLINTVARSVTHDAELTLTDIKDVGLRLRSFDSGNLDMRIVPSSATIIDGVSYVVADEEKSAALFAALKQRQPLPDYGRTGVTPIFPEDVRLAVLNGTDVDKLASGEASILAESGYQIHETANTEPHPQTTVYYRLGAEDKGRLVADTYGAELLPLGPPIATEAEVALVLGSDFSGAQAYPEAREPTAPDPPSLVTPGAPRGDEPPLAHAC
ncbi:MAG: LCP family protein, partial [Actinobacteria bacterium]|nr:LCP family protein [Actinomycetota bacterium]